MMDTAYQDLHRTMGYPGASLTILFTSPAHLADSLAYVRKIQKEQEFLNAINRVCLLFWHDAAPRLAFTGGPDGPEPAVPGGVIRVTFAPDTPRAPSFVWRAERIVDKPGAKNIMLLHGGLIYWQNNDTWSVHT
jgi:hypothetical protein